MLLFRVTNFTPLPTGKDEEEEQLKELEEGFRRAQSCLGRHSTYSVLS